MTVFTLENSTHYLAKNNAVEHPQTLLLSLGISMGLNFLKLVCFFSAGQIYVCTLYML